MNSFNLVKAGGDPKHFFDALAMSEREDRKASQNRKMIKMPSSSPELCWLAKEVSWCTSQTFTAAHCHLDQFMLVRAHHLVFFLWVQAIHTNPRGASSPIYAIPTRILAYWSRSYFRQHLVFQCCEPYYVISKSKQRQRWASWSSCSGSRAFHNSRLDWRRQRQICEIKWRDISSVTWYASDSTACFCLSWSFGFWAHCSTQDGVNNAVNAMVNAVNANAISVAVRRDFALFLGSDITSDFASSLCAFCQFDFQIFCSSLNC